MSSRAEEKRQRREEREARAAAETQAAARRRRLGILGGAGLAAVAVVLVLVLIGGGGSDKKATGLGSGKALTGQAEINRLFAGIPQNGIQLGDPKAPVQMVEYVDLQCPFCAEFARNAIPDLVKRYVRTGKVSIQLRVLTFLGPDSVPAAKAQAGASFQNRGWQFAELFYRNQGEENTGYVTPRFLARIAGGVSGLNAKKALAAAKTPAAKTAVDSSARAASIQGVNSTPTLYAGPRGGSLRKLNVSSFSASEIESQLDPLLK